MFETNYSDILVRHEGDLVHLHMGDYHFFCQCSIGKNFNKFGKLLQNLFDKNLLRFLLLIRVATVMSQ